MFSYKQRFGLKIKQYYVFLLNLATLQITNRLYWVVSGQQFYRLKFVAVNFQSQQ